VQVDRTAATCSTVNNSGRSRVEEFSRNTGNDVKRWESGLARIDGLSRSITRGCDAVPTNVFSIQDGARCRPASPSRAAGLGCTRAGCVLHGDTSCRREGADADSLGGSLERVLSASMFALRTLRRPHDSARFSDRARSVKKVLEHLGLPTTGPPIANPAHAGPEGLDLARDSLRRWARHKGSGCRAQGFVSVGPRREATRR